MYFEAPLFIPALPSWQQDRGSCSIQKNNHSNICHTIFQYATPQNCILIDPFQVSHCHSNICHLKIQPVFKNADSVGEYQEVELLVFCLLQQRLTRLSPFGPTLSCKLPTGCTLRWRDVTMAAEKIIIQVRSFYSHFKKGFPEVSRVRFKLLVVTS